MRRCSRPEAVELEPKKARTGRGSGSAQYRAGDWKAAVAALGESDQELGSARDGIEWFPSAMAHWHSGDKDASPQECYDQAVQWMEKNQPKDGHLRGLQAEAAELMGIE